MMKPKISRNLSGSPVVVRIRFLTCLLTTALIATTFTCHRHLLPLTPVHCQEAELQDIELARSRPLQSGPTGALAGAIGETLAGAAASTRPVKLQPPLVGAESEREDAAQFGQHFDYHANMPVITKRELANAVKQATSSVRELRDVAEPQVTGARLQADAADASPVAAWLASSLLHRSAIDGSPTLLNLTNQALISEEATRLLARQYKLDRVQVLRGLPLISVDQTSLGKLCQRPARAFNCIAGRFRSLSGHCNNVQNPDWGSANSPLARYAPARYADNVSRPLRSLPSPRAVSAAIYAATGAELPANASTADLQGQHAHLTTMMSFFGQFLFHDLGQVSQFAASTSPGQSIRCCGTNQQQQQKQVHPECMQVESAEGDFCLDYVRSTPAVRSGCNLGPRDQLNLVSSYLDGSAIYGSSEEQSARLRTFVGGRLRSQRLPVASDAASSTGGGAVTSGGNQLELLPQIKLAGGQRIGGQSTAPEVEADAVWMAAAEQCRQMARMRRKPISEADRCFQAGDVRANGNIGLTLMHTIWMREHNQIADRLGQLNKHWNDQRLFEESRRLVVAELQHITYNEFLPALLGEEVMQRFNLSVLNQGYSTAYDPSLNAGLANELAAGVFPFILSTIPRTLERYSERLEMLGITSVADTFMDPSELFKRNRFAQFLMGMISQNAMEPALGIMQMTAQMGVASSGNARSNRRPKRAAAEPPELDLVALTVQQARDHGLKSYLYWRQVCQLRPTVDNWQELAQVMPAQVVDQLSQLYTTPQELDLYLAVLENPLPGAALGPTFVCLLARQFFHLKHGDRFWYENDLPGSAFSLRQLDQIRQSSLAKVVCRNSQTSISFIQPAPMLTSDPYLNAYQYCTNRAMVQLDLASWHQPVTSAAQQVDADELALTGNALARSRRLAEENAQLISRSFRRAKRQLEQVAYEETVRLRRSTGTQQVAGAHSTSHAARAGYRYLPRLKRQTLKLNNQSLIFELATNEVVRSLVRQGKDREQAQSVQADIRDFLHSLEGVQLDNLLENSAEAANLAQFVRTAGQTFLSDEQRLRLTQTGELSDPLSDLNELRSSSVSMDCQDDERAFPCDHTTPFRTITGWCNNLQNPKFGQSFTPLDRLLASAYHDNLGKARQWSVLTGNNQSVEPLELPSARLISTTIHDDQSHLHVRYSLALMQFGQFGVDHDLTRTPFSVALDGSLLDCSACDSGKTLHRDCMPIPIPDDDAHFQSAKARELTGPGRKCLHFVRSLNGQTGLGPRQQLNALTAYLDGSNIYGSDNCEAKSLRTFTGGRLNSSHYPATAAGLLANTKDILPITRANPECVTPGKLCFHAGDQRASEQPGLTAIHTVFMRLHNSIVNQLAQINRHWNDEKLYQHGRRIVGAIMQRITYNEFAPRLLGLDYMSKFDLLLKQVGYSNHYDENCSASVLNEFAAAAFRMGHSLIRPAFPLLNRQFKPIGKAFQLRKAFFNSQRILQEPHLVDAILRGIVSTPVETLDNQITEELTNHLFERPKEPFSGMDLMALNVQRARDHGVPGYNRYRVKCNLTRANTFDELSGEIPSKLIKRLASLYAHVDDIDLFTGGMSELPVHGGIIGPTLGCIIGMQLSRLKRCDRFWHETGDPWLRFSAPQLAEIRKVTLARVICQESDNIDTIQRNAMDVSDHFLNPRVACSSLPALELSAWRENAKSCLVNKLKFELGQSKRVSPCKSCTCTQEGAVCRTAKINCLRMMRQVSSVSSIMADKSCLVQCAWALDMQPLAA